MKKIRYLAASERINYGDLLFPLVFKYYFEKDFKFYNYGLIETDNTYFGAHKTYSYKSLTRNISKDDIIVIGGGEVFFSRWSLLVSFIYPFYNYFFKWRLFKKIELFTNATSHIMGGKGSYTPYVPNFRVPTYYIAVGGQFNKGMNTSEKESIKQQLNNSKSLSVRDLRTLEALEKENIKCKLIPDSAILMSKIYSKNKLEKLITLDKKNCNTKFIFLQVAVNKGPENLKKFVNELSEIAKRKSLKVICCPIGLASGHDDHIILKKMVNISDDWIYIHPKNIFDIMFLISSAKLYIGTSLHGAITAFAYGIPIVPLNKKIKKLDSFVNTWANNIYINSVDFDQIQDSVEKAIQKWDAKKGLKLLNEQQRIVEKHFEEIKKSML